MEGIEKPHADKYKEITNNWNYDASCTLTSLPVWDFENFKRLIFVVQTVQCMPMSHVGVPSYYKLKVRHVKLSHYLCLQTFEGLPICFILY
jgi:hypothetical protein